MTKQLKFIRRHPDAIIPTKAHQSDSGYDLHIIKWEKTLCESPRVEMFDTGITVISPEGYYCEVVPRSSLSKTGFMLANSVGIIDNEYRGSIKIALLCPNDSTPELPLKGFQLIVRKLEQLETIEIDSIEDETQRGEGGFGSTG